MTLIQITEVLRKNQRSSLWNINHRKWNENQKKMFEELRTGIKIRKTGRVYPTKSVTRISDGKKYLSVKECALDNKTSPSNISRSKKYKKI